jgi:hypothetical protein
VVISRALELFRKGELNGLITCIDFRAAFDSLKHSFIWKTLEHMNVGPQLISHLKTLYLGAKSAALNFVTKTNYFNLEMSTRQGDPVAVYSFILVLEVLPNKLKHEINPIVSKDKSFKASSVCYADDYTGFPRNAVDLKRTLDILDNFRPISGLSINREKSEIMELGETTVVCKRKPNFKSPESGLQRTCAEWTS